MSDRETRVPYITDRGQVSEAHRESFDSIVESRGSVQGPFSVLMNSPEVAKRAGHLGAYIRFESELSGADRELAIITTAREFDCPFEWVHHEPLARDEGVSDEAITAVATEAPLDDLEPREASVVQFGREIFRTKEVSDETFQAVSDIFGDKQVTELTATIGYYGLIAVVLNTLEVLPEDGSPAAW